MTDGQSGCFMWMVLITGGMALFIAVDKGCVTIGPPAPQVTAPAPLPKPSATAKRFKDSGPGPKPPHQEPLVEYR